MLEERFSNHGGALEEDQPVTAAEERMDTGRRRLMAVLDRMPLLETQALHNPPEASDDDRLVGCIEDLKDYTGEYTGEIAKGLLEMGRVDAFKRYAASVDRGEDLSPAADLLVEMGAFDTLSDSVSRGYFRDLPFRVADALIAAERAWTVARYIESFDHKNALRILRRLLDAGETEALLMAMTECSAADAGIAEQLFRLGRRREVLEYINKFIPEDRLEIIRMTIRHGLAIECLESLFYFVKSFSEGDGDNILEMILDAPCDDASKERLHAALEGSFRFLTDLGPTVAERVIRVAGLPMLCNHLNSFQNLNQDIAEQLVDGGQVAATAFINRFERFQIQDQNRLARRLIKNGYAALLDVAIPKMTGLKGEIALALIEKGSGQSVPANADRFVDLDHNAVALALIKHGKPGLVLGHWVSGHASRLQGLSLETAKALIATSQALYVVEGISQFLPEEANRIAHELIESGNACHLKKGFHAFPGLDQRVVVALIGEVDYDGAKAIYAKGPAYWQPVPEMSSQEKEDFAFLFDESIPLAVRLHPEARKWIGQLPREYLLARQNFALLPDEADDVSGRRRDLLRLDNKGRVMDKKALYDALFCPTDDERAISPQDPAVYAALTRGRDLFGASIMFAYMNRVGLSRHDAVHFMADLEALYRASGLDQKTFAANILLQVAKDGSAYVSGTAHHEFALICQGLRGVSFDRDGTFLTRLQEYRDISPEYADLVDLLNEEGPFASWKHLKKAKEAYDLSLQEDILKELAREPNPRMRAYVSKLAFHPGIAMDRVFDFWRDTATFLEIDDEHAPKAISYAKKPSNYLTVEHLDWQASDLRDALVGRAHETRSVMDRLQTIPAAEYHYEAFEHPYNDMEVPENLHRVLVAALGSYRQKIRGEAKDSERLFAALGTFLTKELSEDGRRIQVTKLVESPLGLALIQRERPDVYRGLQELLFDPALGIPRPDPGRETFRVRIGAKSDPTIAVAGNDTASCMPFASGKNNVYTFNPNCGQLVMERLQPDGTWRTVSQSVLTINQEIGGLASELMRRFQESGEGVDGGVELSSLKFHELIDPADFARPRYLACDNIEIAKNIEGQRSQSIAATYERFFKEYLEKHAAEMRVSKTKVPVGKGYSPADLGFTSEPNNTIPLVPMTYSDNRDDEHFVIKTGLEDAPADLLSRPSVRPIEAVDVYAVAHLESKAFDGLSLQYGIHKVQNNLLGVTIANAYFGRPNLSFIVQAEGRPASAYLVAYEGRIQGEPIVYVDDMAAESQGHPAGGRVLNAFIDAYLDGYQNAPAFPPILADMRESTSWKLVTNQLDRLGRRRSLKTRMVELSTWGDGEEMKKAVILVGRSDDELDRLQAQAEGLIRADADGLSTDQSTSDGYRYDGYYDGEDDGGGN